MCIRARSLRAPTSPIAAGRFAAVGAGLDYCIGEHTQVIEADGRYLVPGLCDAHMHVESGMVTVTEFCRAVIPHGTTSMFIDPHEIANVLGLPGVRLMHDEAAAMPVNVFVQMPSCVPSAPGLETPGATIDADDVREAMGWPNIVGLGEMMNFPGVAANDEKMLAEIAATRDAGKVVGGHYASPNLGRPFAAYVAGGPADDHEGTRPEDAIARVRNGMRAMLRLGSAWYDVAAQVQGDHRVRARLAQLHPLHRRFPFGHAGQRGAHGPGGAPCHRPGPPPHHRDPDGDAQHRVPLRAGAGTRLDNAGAAGGSVPHLGPGRAADRDSDRPWWRAGRAHGTLRIDVPPWTYPDFAHGTVHLGKSLEASDFEIRAPEGRNNVTARAIGVIENQAGTKALVRDLAVEDGLVAMGGDVCQIALVERHRGTGGVVNALVSGFGYTRPCAVASTVAHDSHHMIVVGTNRADMARAANQLGEVGGGVIVVSEGRELALVELRVAGLMSDERAEVVAAKAEQVVAAMRACGCTLNNAYMQHSLLALVVIPELRISDRGLVDVRTFETVDLFV